MFKDYLNASSEQCNRTVQLYVYNLTSSYADQRNEAPMVATSVIMFILAALFFNLNLFSRLSDISAILNPSVRLFLSTSLSLFLPVMSYLFSEAKNDAANGGHMTELSVRARTILTWMLLVELLRRKVEEILVTAGGVQGYSGTIERAARIGWLGYLVFYNLRSAGKKALFGILWVLAASKLVQRFITLELGKRSFAYGKNPQLVSSYMKTLHDHDEQEQHASNIGSELLKRCNYVVMGEEELEKTAGPNGYSLLESTEAITKDGSPVVTVGKIWRLADDNNDRLLQRNPRLKRMCLSFALYKLLRRRLEDIPISSAEARSRNCHDLIFKGLCQERVMADTDHKVEVEDTTAAVKVEDRDTAAAAVNLLQVFNDEIQFLCEYYHSVQPVVFASPFFFLANYILFPILVWASCILTILLCSNGDVSYAFQSFRDDNHAAYDGIIKLPGCILTKITTSAPELFTVVDICVTVLLFLSFAYEEVWEFVVFLLSNWFMVSLLSSYTCKPRRWLSGVIRRIMWVRSRLSQPNVCFKQFSVLWFCCCHISTALPTKAVPKRAKKAIMERLDRASNDVAPLTKGMDDALKSDEHRRLFSWACGGDGVAEVILIWHIATELLEAEHALPKRRKPEGANYREVATALSRYCAYLVAFRPELLPDDKDGTERVYRETKEELKKEMGCVWYYCSGVDARSRKLKEIQQGHGHEEATTTMTALHKGAKLGKALMDMHGDVNAAADDVWKLLADLWTEVVTYAAPTSSELHVKAHKEALAQGGEFITVLWALTTHTGIAHARGPVAAATHTGIARAHGPVAWRAPPPPAFV
ncbi:unnamed protein product [Miscanthus lutarioriparius]|uniref:DUF4220 domain-containing protein n=1 Tax=Miscanthus lutarioriparius TaxID=422564 RepID=A0A811SP74_9POAL|nr:unnamed protein product [Miscanthus lutarioriparius]